MARQYLQKASPNQRKSQAKSADYLPPWTRPKPRTDTRQRAAPPIGNHRLFPAVRHLLPMAEEDSGEAPDLARSGYPEFDNFLDVEEDGDEDNEDEDPFAWDEETTLVVALMKDDLSDNSERDEVFALIQSLNGPMAAESANLKRDLAQTLVPAVKTVKGVHHAMDQKVDLKCGEGIIIFDEVCKKMERQAISEDDDLKIIYAETQRNVRNLFSELKQAYDKRDQLWENLQVAFDECADRAVSKANALAATTERTISALEKKGKELVKEDSGSTKAQEKMIMELLKSLG